ncbi:MULTISPECIES: carboxymuconolactone decarboxylase family protein [Motilimonas]|uniref:Carboxymuconolactone decarboxylase family protein n=1 Tax=Motilimonas cestriensis TaxID=2742685 RepID=A0ABS8WG25_9GAMM|nr:carboxymuconolactone decarboxylase family protein [Motilimonas sp. 1_MG-2023]MCE0559269.1 carboxymuconolactone decarboxylase family protein [Motilimonas sp. E26]MCE2597400.1 carboxymuconolactone decarboxylase family protein [Motilimonas cestriensis]MDO6525744.1 carboxymuconolactone decarboxylase family protein [Motilimonas sp. 1_MG-2023]
MLTENQQNKYEEFYESTHENEFLDSKTEVLVGLAASIAMNCKPCTSYYLHQAKKVNIVKGEISEVIAKVMAVSAGQKRLQTSAVLKEHKIDLDSFT